MKKWLVSFAVLGMILASTPMASMAATTVSAQSTAELDTAQAPVTFGFVLQGYETRDMITIQVAVDESVKASTFQNVATSLVKYELVDSNDQVVASFYNQGYGTQDHLFYNVTAGTYTVRITNMTADTVGGETYMNW
ncbi:hypothetical protein JJB07_15835 [Tumebacillus sp. ITR2]|uniref:NEAT domain-containing protein n=1 Tax=Tumebacillus amylolyticus TaxID=2801339 RepID=A0ABS1JCS9_9BACL|nr:hypothetical protein [Tumebacillus amylolyticus]MBL0388089.1 hypothetical protein [Tumebacillus amylolyticus]